MGDILQDIPDEDVPLLRNLYKNHQTEAPYVYSLLNTYIVWKNKKPNLNCISLFGVNDDWLETGTFILLFEYACNNNLVIYSLEDDCQTIFKSLTQTTRIDWEKRTIWSPVMATHIPLVYNIFRELDKWPRKITTDKMWMLEREKALQLEIQCPDEVYIAKLNQSYIPYINSVWTHRFDGSLEYLSIFCEMNNCYGVFLKSNDKLVSWALKTFLGHIAVLRTDPQHFRKGYATLVIKVLAKDIAKDGHCPVTDTMRGNVASERLFRKLGFHVLDASMYFETY